MIQFPKFSRRDLAAAPRYLKGAALFSGGAVAGAVVSTVAGYALVSTLYPGASMPAAEVAALPPAPAMTASAPTLARAPADIVPVAPRDALPLPEAPRIALAAMPPARGALPFDDTADAARRATLGLQDGADTSFDIAVPNLRPLPRPDGLVVARAPAQDPASPRPRPRPEALVAALSVETETEVPGIRPAPRPDNIVLAGAATASSDRRTITRSAGRFSGTCGRELARDMPRRPSGAAAGQAFFASLGGVSGSDRDAKVIRELARGNVPAFMRELQPVTFRGKDSRGADTEIVICVTPDYLALGDDRDYVRVPLGLPAAARIAKAFDMTLPTPHMVDAIYVQADVRLSPAPMTPGPQMSSTGYFLTHNATIEGQLRGRGGLVAGQKKDVVMANRMASKPGRVAIYGWHRSSGSPIQPVSTVHGANYADYSHGVRLVSKTAYLNGRAVALDELLASRQYASLLNKDGPVPGPVIRIASR